MSHYGKFRALRFYYEQAKMNKKELRYSVYNEKISNHSTVCVDDQDPGSLLQQRLELVEDLWKTVLKSECPPDQTERLLRLKQLSDPSKSNQDNSSKAIVQLITKMDLAEAISAARAFSLYFQLVNILEQRIEEDSYLESIEKTRNALQPSVV